VWAVHFEILTEDQSSKIAMDILIPKLLGNDVTYRIHPYKGIGRLPRDLHTTDDPSKRQLLNQLPRLLRGYGNTPDSGTIVVICDLDDRDKQSFLTELQQVLDACDPKPKALFCLAIEEFEAWYLGDYNAIRAAYPKAKDAVLRNYKNASICGTWECLADAVYNGGRKALKKRGWRSVGEEKSMWAKMITPHMDVENNQSPSFTEMQTRLRDAVQSA
jgi:hypothetical protein